MENKALKARISSLKREDYFNFANLHIHSDISDGKEDFDTLIEQAQNLGLKHISITDHNTVEGYKKTKHLNDPVLIPGVEFDCFYQTTLIHILGYGIDFKSPYIEKLCAENRIEGIHKAGGIAVFAHPCCSSVISLDYLVKKLKSFGLDGIEAYYPYNRHRGIIKFHSRKKPFKLAKKYDLILTGGTDEHGTLSKH